MFGTSRFELYQNMQVLQWCRTQEVLFAETYTALFIR